MRLSVLLAAACAASGAACAGAYGRPASGLASVFGRVTARVGPTPVAGAWGPDSVVAVYLAEAGTLQIEGARVGGPRVPAVRVTLACAAVPEPGAHPIAGPRAPVQVQAVLPGVPGAGAAAGARVDGTARVFVADSAAGILELDTLDLAGGRIAGRFRAAVRDVDRPAAAALPLSGAFWGRVRTVHRPPGGRPLRLPPASERDCAADRRASPAGTGRAAAAAGVLTSNVALQLSGTHSGAGAALGTVVPRP